MAFKVIFLLVALLAVEGLVSGGPLKGNKDVVAAATESDGEGGLEMYGARNESERHARSAAVSDDMLSLIMAQAYIESSDNDDDLAFAQEVHCRKDQGYELTHRILRNIINTGGKLFDIPFSSTTYVTVNFRPLQPTLGNKIFESDFHCDAEERLMGDYLDTLKPEEYPSEIWLSQSPCWRKCANSLMAFFKDQVHKPTIYFNHLWVGEAQFRDREIDCMAVMHDDGFDIEIWDWGRFLEHMTEKLCIDDIVKLLEDKKYQLRMVKLQQTIETIHHRAHGNPKCPKDQNRVMHCPAKQNHNNNNNNNYYQNNNNKNDHNNNNNYYQNNNKNDYNYNNKHKNKAKKGNKKNYNYNNNGNGYHPNDPNEEYHPNDNDVYGYDPHQEPHQEYHPKANNGNGNHLNNYAYKHDKYWNPKRQ